jgi:hypothetical protein
MLGNDIKKGSVSYAVKGWLQIIYLFWTNAIPARLRIQHARKATVADIRNKLWPDLPPDQTGLRKFRQAFTGKR